VIAWDSIEFEKASRIFRYSFPDPCAFYARSYYAPFWCNFCNSSDHETKSCLYYAYCAQHDFVSLLDSTDVVLTLPNSSFPLAQCTELEVGEPFPVVASVVDVYVELEDTLDEVYDLVEAPLEGSCHVSMHEEFPSCSDDIDLPNHLDHSPISPMCSQCSPTPRYYIDVPIGNPVIFSANVNLSYEDNMFDVLGENADNCVSLSYFRRYDPSIKLYCVCL